jgi:hypothetical protein
MSLFQKNCSMITARRIIAFGLTVLPLLAVGAIESSTGQSTIPLSNSIKIDQANFSLTLPPDMNETPVTGGTDSLVRTFEGPTLKLLIDYGSFGDSFKCVPDGVTHLQKQEERIDGKIAKLVTYQLPAAAGESGNKYPYFAGAYFADLGRGPRTHLSIGINARSQNAQALGMQILRSVHFSD